LFAKKYASHEEQADAALGAIIAFTIIYIITDIAMSIYTKVAIKFKEEWVVPEEGKEDDKKSPSQVVS